MEPLPRDVLRRRLAEAASFAVYYGFDQEAALQEFDLIVLEPCAHSDAQIGALRRSGALVCGYLSLLETDDASARGAEPGDFLMVEGKRRVNPVYANWIMDPRSEHWIALLMERAERNALRCGCDGIFLDTIGDVEDHSLPKAISAQLIPAAAHLVRRLRERFPDVLFIQNSGIDSLHRLTAPYIDGVCWENFPLEWPVDWWSINKLDELERMSRGLGVRVLLLAQLGGGLPGQVGDGEGRRCDGPSGGTAHGIDMEERGLGSLRETERRAADRGFLFYAAPGDYTAGVSECLRRSGERASRQAGGKRLGSHSAS